jgi:hypothetical protein|tara:strand:- start:518 stop:865 length:348 start_codon:yes stop_codon:yes gene_type:complete
MTNLNITSGVWCCASSDTHDGWTAVWADSGYCGVKQVALIPTEFSEAVSNAKLMAEAGTVANECGRTPNQLLDERDELLACCKEFVRKVECGEARSKRSYAQMKAVIDKIENSEE